MATFRPDESVRIGGQNMSERGHGSAFTGEVSALMLKDVGADFVLLGHSERRQFFGESDEIVAEKMERAIVDGIDPVLCIGETLEEFESGKTKAVLKMQLATALESLVEHQLQNLLISYEPVWAIGTGKSAEPKRVSEIHHFLKEELGELFSEEAASKVPILYGGSVNEKNITQFLTQPHISGALIGGAALDIKQFNRMIYSTSQSSQ